MSYENQEIDGMETLYLRNEYVSSKMAKGLQSLVENGRAVFPEGVLERAENVLRKAAENGTGKDRGNSKYFKMFFSEVPTRMINSGVGNYLETARKFADLVAGLKKSRDPRGDYSAKLQEDLKKDYKDISDLFSNIERTAKLLRTSGL